MSENAAKQEAEHLAKQKTLLDKYHKAMAVINNSHNFQPTFEPGEQLFTREELPSIHLENLVILTDKVLMQAREL